MELSDEWADFLANSEDSDEGISFEMSQAFGYAVNVTTWADPFELRRVQIQWSQNDAVVAGDDTRIGTMDFMKLTAGAPDDQWLEADFISLVAHLGQWWTAIDQLYTDQTKLHKYSIYKLGPDVHPPQVPVYEQIVDLPGGSAGPMLPPQVAVTVTEMAGSKPHWGRIYLPSMATSACSVYGRCAGIAPTVADAFDNLYQSLKTDQNLHAVVYRRPLPERAKKNGVLLPARPGTAWTVDTIQVDDVFDVMRSRRWKYPGLRVQRGIDA